MNNQNSSPAILWVNLMVETKQPGLANQFSQHCRVRQLRSNGRLTNQVKSNDTDIICFEYDYPDCDSLNVLKQTREQFPNVPVVMITLMHSEELAIWALRNRLLDYYYKPIDNRTVSEISRGWTELFQRSNGQLCNDSLCSLQTSYPDEVRFKNQNQTHHKFDTVINFIAHNYSRKITESMVSDLVDMTRFKFSRQFKQIFGRTFQDYLLEYRIEMAGLLLQNPNAKVSDVSYAVGFTDPSYFTRVFKRLTGYSPSNCKADHTASNNHRNSPQAQPSTIDTVQLKNITRNIDN